MIVSYMAGLRDGETEGLREAVVSCRSISPSLCLSVVITTTP
jgi:hypothetical protein